ncbi:MAG: hypothetical protein AAFY39_03025 [Pseudomonadota bacterium]
MMVTEDSSGVIATVRASAGRRVLGIGSLWALAVLVFYLALTQSPAIGWQLFLFVLGGCSVWLAELMRRATAHKLELTRTELRSSDGTTLALVDEMTGLDRGMFAFKPSNGFLLSVSKKEPVTWRPGMWWRLGKRVGVGGMTPGPQTKFMAEMISAMMAERDGV